VQISFTKPLDRAWTRMKRTLFAPFSLGTWFILGFTSWLANIGSSSSRSGGHAYNRISADRNDFRNGGSYDDFQEFASSSWDSFQEFFIDGFWGIFVIGMLVVICVLMLLATWLSSRGQFLFLDNLVHNRTEVSRPWREYSAQGNSLFLWQIAYGLISLFVFGNCAVAGFISSAFFAASDISGIIVGLLAVATGSLVFVLVLVAIYVHFFLFHFVVPIMYREKCSTTQAWQRFLVLFREHPGSFVLYGFCYLLISILSSLVFLIAGVMTCCIGLFVLAIPYIGAVVTLPMSVLGRFFDLEFIDQFGDPILLNEIPQIDQLEE